MRPFATTALALSLLAAPALADDYTAGDLTIKAPWTREMPPGSTVGGGFMTIANSGGASDALTRVTTDRADHGEVHEMSMDAGVMKMRELADGLEIPAGETVELKPGGYHVMFMGVTDGFEEGESVEAVLVFEKAGEVPVTFAVAPVGAGMAPDDAGGHMHDDGAEHEMHGDGHEMNQGD